MNILKHFVTLGPIGYMNASGTVASLVTLPLVILAHHYLSTKFYMVLIALIYAASIYALNAVRKMFKRSDPREVVIDEVVGMFVTFLAIPVNADRLLLGFLLFRAFDISKLGSAWIEKRPDAHGIMLDDVIAGLLSNLIMHIVIGFGWL